MRRLALLFTVLLLCVGFLCLVCYSLTRAPNPTLLVNAQDGNYAIQTSDCGGNVVNTGANAAITLPSASGFPANCLIRIANGNPSRAQALSNFPAGLPAGCGGACLYPTQGVTIAITNGAWMIVAAPPKWQPAGGVTLYVDQNGSDSNDGLAAGSSNALASINTAIQRWSQAIDCSANSQSVTLDNGSFAASKDVAGVHVWYAANCGSPNSNLNIVGSGHANVTVTCNAASNCFDVEEPATVTIVGITISTTGNTSNGIFVRQGATADVSDVAWTGFPLGNHVLVQTGAHYNETGPTYVDGSAGAHLVCQLNSYCVSSHTITVAGGLTFNQWWVAEFNSTIDASPLPTFAGSGTGTGTTTTGTSCLAEYNSQIRTGGVTIPGTSGTCSSSQATNGSYIGNF